MEDQRSISPLSSTREVHRSRLTDNAGSYSTLQQNEDDAEKTHVAAHIISTLSMKRRMSRFGWWWEVYTTALAVTSTAAVIAVLVSVHGKPLASWKLPIQPNSLVAVFSTIAKSALLVPIAECISQLKWSYFESPRALSHMQVFDDASRGPWGALVMLWKTRATALLASLGAFITIMLLAFEPFTQQVVRVEIRDMWMANETSAVSYAPAFKDYRLGYDVDERRADPNGRLTFTLAMMAAWTGRASLYQSNNVCGTKMCTYPSHVSLSAQTKCETKEIRTTNAFGCAYYIRNGTTSINRTLEEDFGVSVDEQSTRRFSRLQDFKDAVRENDNVAWYGMNCTIEKLDFPAIFITYQYLPGLKVQNLTGERESHTVLFTNSGYRAAPVTVFGNAMVQQEKHHSFWGTDTLDSENITGSPFAFCTSKRYTFLDRFPTLDNFTLGTFTCLETANVLPGIANLDTFGEFNATLSHCSMHLVSSEYTNPAFGDNPDNIYLSAFETGLSLDERSTLRPLRITEEGTTGNSFEDTAVSDGLAAQFVIRPYPMEYLSQMIDETLYSDNTQDFLLQRRVSGGGWPAVIHDIGKVAGEYMRSSDTPDARNATGRAWAPQPFIRVEWVWLILPLILVVLSVVFLIMTAVQSRRKPYLYKTSALAATMHGLEGWTAEDMRGDGKCEMGRDLVEKARGVEARLVSGEDGGLRFVRQR